MLCVPLSFDKLRMRARTTALQPAYRRHFDVGRRASFCKSSQSLAIIASFLARDQPLMRRSAEMASVIESLIAFDIAKVLPVER
jgi:hypothetical protein